MTRRGDDARMTQGMQYNVRYARMTLAMQYYVRYARMTQAMQYNTRHDNERYNGDHSCRTPRWKQAMRLTETLKAHDTNLNVNYSTEACTG